MKDTEATWLKDIKLKVAVLMAVITPCVTATGAYWGLKLQIEERDRLTSDRISNFEATAYQTFVDKTAFDKMNDEVKAMHDDVIEVKTILKRRDR